jgi:hypothetical protein
MRSLLRAKAPGMGRPKRVTGRALATSWRIPSSKAAGSVPAVHSAQYAQTKAGGAGRARLTRAARQAPYHPGPRPRWAAECQARARDGQQSAPHASYTWPVVGPRQPESAGGGAGARCEAWLSAVVLARA